MRPLGAACLLGGPGCEAVRELEVEDMPLIVAIDSLGKDMYESGPAAYLESLKGGK